jgi:Ca2+-binding RTX toxin-like protein
VINGGPGNDLLEGGSGNDVFLCGDGTDTIIDFNPAVDVRSPNCEDS